MSRHFNWTRKRFCWIFIRKFSIMIRGSQEFFCYTLQHHKWITNATHQINFKLFKLNGKQQITYIIYVMNKRNSKKSYELYDVINIISTIFWNHLKGHKIFLLQKLSHCNQRMKSKVWNKNQHSHILYYRSGWKKTL